MSNNDLIKTEVPEGTKFEIRGFMNGDPAAEAATKEVSAEEADAIMAARSPIDPTAEEIVQSLGGEEVIEEEGEPAAQKEPKIRIGTREFANADEAWAYAQELEQEKIAADAFRQGVEIAQRAAPGNPETVTPQADPEEKFDEEFYSNPKDYLAKRDQRMAEKIQTDIQRKAEMARKTEDTWTDFKRTYPDLAGQDEFADVQAFVTAPQNWAQLQHMETKKALKIAADAIREKYSRILKSRLPGEQLLTTKVATSPGNGNRVTTPAPTEKGSTFVQQMRNANRKKAAGPVRR